MLGLVEEGRAERNRNCSATEVEHSGEFRLWIRVFGHHLNELESAAPFFYDLLGVVM